MIMALVSGAQGPDGMPMTEFLLHPTGEFSARFLIIAMILTPLRMLLPRSGFLRWMMKRRRYFGVAAFCYAAFHTLLYIVDMGSLRAMLAEFTALGIWTGWLAMVIFIPLAITSTDGFVRRMGPAWKRFNAPSMWRLWRPCCTGFLCITIWARLLLTLHRWRCWKPIVFGAIFGALPNLHKDLS